MRAILIAMILAPLAVTQQSAPVVVKKTAKFDVTTQLVVVNVAVKTKNGDLVDNLKTSDFTVTEALVPATGSAQSTRAGQVTMLANAPEHHQTNIPSSIWTSSSSTRRLPVSVFSVSKGVRRRRRGWGRRSQANARSRDPYTDFACDSRRATRSRRSDSSTVSFSRRDRRCCRVRNGITRLSISGRVIPSATRRLMAEVGS